MSLILSGSTGISGSAGVIDAQTFAGQANTYYTDITSRLGYTPLSNVNPSYTGTLTGDTGVINIGSGQLYKDSNGNIGIATSSPNARLTLFGSTGSGNGQSWQASGWPYSVRAGMHGVSGSEFYLSSNWTGTAVENASYATSYVNISNNGLVSFGTGAANTVPTERVRIDSLGNVGIGTSSPGVPLSVYRSNGVWELIQIQNELSGSGAFYRAIGSLGGTVDIGAASDASSTFVIRTNSIERLRITSNGTVGIGTTAPEAILHVNGTGTGTNSYLGSFTTSNPSGVVLFVRNTSATGWSSLRFHNDANTRVGSIGSGNSSTSVLANMMYVSSQNGFPVVLSTGTGATPVERFRVTADGDVCVGTTSNIGSGLFSLIAASNRNGFVSRAGDNANYTFAGQNTGGSLTFSVTGAGALSAATITETSSRDLKTNFRNVENSLEKVLKLTAYIYDRKDGSEKDELGLIAEEVDPVIDNLVMYDEEGKPVGVKYTRVGVLCLEAIKEMHKELMELKAQVNK